METLLLRTPTAADFAEIAAFRQEFLAAGQHLYGTSGLEKYDDLAEWLSFLRATSAPETCPSHLAVAEQALAVSGQDGRLIGMANLRKGLTPTLRQIGGHLGYCVRPAEQGKGFGKEQLRLCLQKYKVWGFDQILITCDDDNAPSLRTILACGGAYEGASLEDDTSVLRFWVPTLY